MNSFTRSMMQIAQGAAKAFTSFPASIACALAFTLVTIVRIHLDWPENKDYNFLFNCLHWSFAFGAIFSMAAITAVQTRSEDRKAFILANIIGLLCTALVFVVLFFFGGKTPELGQSSSTMLSDLTQARIAVAMFVSFLTFIVLAGLPKESPDLAKSLFMTHKSFFIATIYGVVLLSGVSGVAAAVQALLYKGMSYKVYSYIAALTGFFTFAVFLGYFPDFCKGELDERREIAEKQPHFIEILFGYVLIPIMIALTIVLILWTGRIIIEGNWPSFMQLSSIATSYAMGGIWLHIMVTHHEAKLATFYRKVYPFTGLLILAFEAWALFVQLQKYGMKTTEYYFGLTWIFAVVSVILLLLLKSAAHVKIISLVGVLSVISVLPMVGYNVLPVASQTARLEKLLTAQNMLVDGKLVPAATEPERKIKEGITDSVTFLAYTSDAKLPAWFEKKFAESEVFKLRFGFKQTWPPNEDIYGGGGYYLSTNLYLASGPIDISNYNWVVKQQKFLNKGNSWGEIKSSKGTYQVIWTINQQNNIPLLKITLDGRVLVEQDLKDYFEKIGAAYPPGDSRSDTAGLDEMSLKIETPEIKALIVFSDVHIGLNVRDDKITHSVNLDAIYLQEK